MAFSSYFILFWNSFLEVDFEFIDVPNPVTLETAIFGDKISRVVKWIAKIVIIAKLWIAIAKKSQFRK